MKNLPNFDWIKDEETHRYCENNFVNDETLEMLREPGNVLRKHPPGQLNPEGFMGIYSRDQGRFLLHGPIDR